MLMSFQMAAAGSDPAAVPAVPNFSPGLEYADSARMFQGIPSIERAANGRLWATWYSGGVTEDDNNYILLCTSGDNGASWQQVLVLDPDGAGPVRAYDQCLWIDPDGRLWLFWAQETSIALNKSRTAQTFAIMTADPGKAGAKWSAPREISKGVMMNKPIVTADSRWLLPIATWFTDGSSRAVVSTDHGATFADLGAANVPVSSRNADEHMIVQRKDSSLWMLVRGMFSLGGKNYTGIGESVSADGGKTWTDVTASSIPHSVSRFFIRKLQSGNMLLVRHDPPNNGKGRSHLAAFLSDDDGLTWKGGLMIDERNGISYPDGVQAPDGSICVVYDYQRGGAKEILMAVFKEEDILAGRYVSSGSRPRVLINKATGINTKSAPNAPVLVVNPNSNGVALLKGTAAGLEPADGELAAFEPGIKLFLNRDYTVTEAPEALRDFQFMRKNIGGAIKTVCRQPGMVYVVTPSDGRDVYSQEKDLLNLGFEKVNLPEFRLFANVLCSVFQKKMKAGEALNVSNWGVLIMPRKN
jgi:predicted neuraminidase